MQTYKQIKAAVRAGKPLLISNLLQLPVLKFREVLVLLKKHKYTYDFDQMAYIKPK